jgi:hypothetical protein
LINLFLCSIEEHKKAHVAWQINNTIG